MTTESPPSEAELIGLAEQALAQTGAPGVATAWWERTVLAGPGAAHAQSGTRVEVVPLAEADVPEPAAGRPHAGYDPLLTRIDPETLRVAGGGWRGGAARTAIVSSRGARAFESRSFAAVGLGPLRWAAVTPAGIDLAALGIEAAALDPATSAGAGAGELHDPLATTGPAVLGADAVAALLDRLRPAFAPGAGMEARRGTRVAASTVSLSDAPRFATTLPRSYDATGTPRQPVPLIQDGVAHRIVSAETGHADGRAEHLVLVGGGAASVDELMVPIERGAYLPTLELGFRVEGGRRGARIDLTALHVDPLAVLASVQALTSGQRTFALGDLPRTVGATVCPALRAAAGVTFAP